MSTTNFKRLNINELLHTNELSETIKNNQITPSLKDIALPIERNTTITPKKLASTPLRNKLSEVSPISTAKITNFNTNFTTSSCHLPSSVKSSTSKKPSLSRIESRNKLKQFQEDQMKTEPKSFEDLLEFQEKNLLVPLEKKNDETFKLLTMKKIKRKSLPLYKSAKKCEDINIETRKSLDAAIEYSIVKKKKIVHSTKKNLYIILTLYDNNGNEEQFPLFKDNDIGIYEYWQAHIIESKVDEDIDTDDEQLEIANSFTTKELKDALDLIETKDTSIIENNKYKQ